jgi:hypothetical protein
MSNKSFNLKKFSRRDPPTAFNPYAPERLDPYRKRVGEPGSEDTVDKLRAGHNPPERGGGMPGGGAAFTDNKPWPADTPLFETFEGTPEFEAGNASSMGLTTDYGIDLQDDYEGQGGDYSSDAVLGRNSTVTRLLDDNSKEGKPHDRKPYNINQMVSGGVLKSLRTRLRNI